MQTQGRPFDYTSQNINAGIDVHKKSWQVSIYSEQLHHKSFHQPADPKVLYNYLSKHLRNGDLEGIYIHDSGVLEDRTLMRMRGTINKEITRYKNRIKAELSFFGIEIPKQFQNDYRYWSNPFMQWLSELQLNRESGTMSISILVDHVKHLRQDLLWVNKKVRELSRQEHYKKNVSLLMSIHGVG